MKTKIFFFLILVFFFSYNHSSSLNDANAYRWKAIGPRGGFVREIAPDRTQPNVWYSVTDSKLYRSSDYGKSWNKILDNISLVAVHPYTSEVLAFGFVESDQSRRGYIWHGGKSGRSWRPSRSEWLQTITWDPTSSKRAYATYNREFLESVDGGYTWRKKGIFSDQYDSCYFVSQEILVSPFDKRTIYLRGYRDCDYYSPTETVVSKDQGRTWKTSEYTALDFHWDPADSGRAFAANCFSVAELTLKGWKTISEVQLSTVLNVPGEPDHFYGFGGCGSTPTIRESTNIGKSWKIAERLQSNIASMAVIDDSQKSLMVGTYGGGIFKRLGAGSWKGTTQGFESASIYRIARSTGGRRIYSSVSYGQLLFTKDELKTFWTAIFPGARLRSGENVELLVADPKEENHVFLATYDRMLMSKDGGKTWRKAIGLGSYYRVKDLVFDNPSKPRLVYAISASALVSSKDGGIHFERVANLKTPDYTNLIRIIVDAQDTRIIYVVSSAGIFRTLNGKSFHLIEAPAEVEIEDGAVLGDPDHFLIVSRGEVYRTLDTGSHWEKISHLPLDHSWDFYRLLAADTTGKRFIVLLNYGRSSFLESKDGGVTWTTQNLASDTSIYDMTDPRYSPIYLATNKGVLMQK